jgi:hypothetical protein
MTNDHLERYFRGQQVSLQWLPLLRSMATEMAKHSEVDDLHRLFFKVGQRWASDTGDFFQSANSLEQLEECVNDFWVRINWGWVEFTDMDDHIDIAHQATPLAEAFGDDALPWSIGLLEGFYQSLFHTLGASEALVVRSVEDACKGMNVNFHFGLVQR